MFLEFEHIPRKKEGEACTCALNQENISKNRYVYALLANLRVKTNLSYLCRYKKVWCAMIIIGSDSQPNTTTSKAISMPLMSR